MSDAIFFSSYFKGESESIAFFYVLENFPFSLAMMAADETRHCRKI